MRYRILIFIFLSILLLLYLFVQKYENINSLIINYPSFPINFASEELPIDSKHFQNKEKFDREFIISSNTVYQFYLYIKRYPIYIPYIEKELEKNKIPLDFKYIAIWESALRNDVVSWAWAAWIWQFMPDTAKRFWLIVNDEVDERYNFEKATSAAILYFKSLYKDFKNRTLVAASYNRWENAILKALEDQNVSSYYDLYLNEETSRYIFRMLAIKYTVKNYFDNKKIIDFVIWWPFTIPMIKTIQIDKIDNIMQWATKNWTNYNTIKSLNPWIKGNSLSSWDWEIKVLK